MKIRFATSLVLLLIAIGLPAAAVSKRGWPWGFRNHQAVVLSVAGNVEATASEARRQREDRADTKLVAGPDLRLDDRDELRTSRFSEARLRFPNGDVIVGDRARVVVGSGRIDVLRGIATVVLSDTGRFDVGLDNGSLTVTGPPGVKLAVVVDADGRARAHSKNGTLTAHGGGGSTATSLPDAPLVLVVEEHGVRTLPVPPATTVTGTCRANTLNVVVDAQSQIFAGGALSFARVQDGANTGSAVINLDPGHASVPVLVKDVVGNIAAATIPCERAP